MQFHCLDGWLISLWFFFFFFSNKTHPYLKTVQSFALDYILVKCRPEQYPRIIKKKKSLKAGNIPMECFCEKAILSTAKIFAVLSLNHLKCKTNLNFLHPQHYPGHRWWRLRFDCHWHSSQPGVLNPLKGKPQNIPLVRKHSFSLLWWILFRSYFFVWYITFKTFH